MRPSCVKTWEKRGVVVVVVVVYDEQSKRSSSLRTSRGKGILRQTM